MKRDNFINKRLVTFSIMAILCMAALATINVSAAQGDDCSNPIVAIIAPTGTPGTVLYADLSQTTCGRVDDYYNTCLGYYDGGEDIIYEIIVLGDVDVDITMDPKGTTWTGILIDNECPDTGTCIAYDSGSSGIRTMSASLLASVGNYWIMVDTWPSPDCIPDFDLTIVEAAPPGPGESCGSAVTAVLGLNSCPGAPYWYQYTPTVNCDLKITSNLAGQMVDTRLYVYDACGGTEVAYMDDDYSGYYNYASTVEFPATAGISYKIFWDPYWDSDPHDFTIEEILPPHDVGVSEIVSPFGSAGPPKATDMVYGDGLNGWQSGLDDGPLTFDITDPGTITSLAPQTVDFFGGCWAEDTWYALEYSASYYCDLYTIDETDGSLTVVGDTGIDGYYETTAGLAYDPTTSTMYASTIEGWDGKLYTVNMGTGAATLVGSMGTDTPIMGIAFDNDGNLYGIDLLDDHLYQINPSDASLTDIGPLGINMNYAQDIAFDRTNEIMYWAMYGSSIPKSQKPSVLAAPPGQALKGYGYLCTIDLSTGTATAGNEFYGSAEIGAFAIPPFVPEECWPMGTYPVSVKVKNYGGYIESFFDVTVTITETGTSTVVYSDTETVIMSMNPGDEITLNTFADWTTTVIGDGEYIVEACTLLFPVDDVPANDCKDEDGCIAQHIPPVAEANGDYWANLGNDFTVCFDSTGSYDPDGTIISYDWDFGDGSTGTGASPCHTYLDTEEAHVLTATLTVTDDDTPANTDTDTALVHVAIHDTDPPIIQIITPEEGDTVNGVTTVKWFAVDDDYPQGVGIPIYLFYRPASAYVTDIHLIADGLTNNIDMFTGEYDWSTSSMSDGSYVLIAETHDMNGNIVHDTIEITITNGNAGTMVSDILITDTTIDSYNWVKNGDDLEIKAGITGPTTEFTTVTADLSGFGMGTNVPATSFDGFTATWTLQNVVCLPSDGPITVTVTVNEIHSNSATITADNTDPELVIEKPLNGLYFFNGKLLTLSRTIIIGPIDIEVDDTDVAKADFYIDNELMKEDNKASFEWYMNIKLRGQHNLEVIVYDGAGNSDSVSQMITVYNFFGN